MFVTVKNIFYNEQSQQIIYTLNISDDIESITVKINGTSQTFTEKINGQIIITIPMEDGCMYTTNIFSGEFQIFTLPKHNLNVNLNLEINIQLIEMNTLPSVIPNIELTTITLNPIYANEEMEYTRGLNDGLILGQMI